MRCFAAQSNKDREPRAAAAAGHGIICPAASGGEAAWAGGIDVLAAPSLLALINQQQRHDRLLPNTIDDPFAEFEPGAAMTAYTIQLRLTKEKFWSLLE